MGIGEAIELILGAAAGLGVVFAALAASTASIRAGEMWAAHDRVKATAMASFAGVSGASALAGIVLGIVWVAVNSPVAG